MEVNIDTVIISAVTIPAYNELEEKLQMGTFFKRVNGITHAL